MRQICWKENDVVIWPNFCDFQLHYHLKLQLYWSNYELTTHFIWICCNVCCYAPLKVYDIELYWCYANHAIMFNALTCLTHIEPAYGIFVLWFWPKKQQFSVASPTP